MALRKRAVAPRATLASALTAALLAMPLAAVASAVDVDADRLDDTVDEAVEQVDETVEQTTEAVKKVVEDGKDNEEPPELPPADDAGGGSGGGGANGGTDGGSTAGPAGGGRVHAAGGATPLDPGALAAREHVTGGQAPGSAARPILQPTRGSLTSWSRLDTQAPPPVVSAPLAYDTPVVAGELVAVPTVASMGALEAVFAPVAATSASGPAPTGVPNSLVATAAGLIMLLGSAHLLHASARLRE